jgi:hypothetical protein
LDYDVEREEDFAKKIRNFEKAGHATGTQTSPRPSVDFK